MAPTDLSPEGIKDPLTLFSYLVETGGSVLTTSETGNGSLVRLGYKVDVVKKDLRMLGLPSETLDSFWWSNADASYSIEDAFRILQILFKGLRPKKGILVLSFQKLGKENPWSSRTVMTVLRQAGFQLFHTFENAEEHLFFCQRL